MKECVHKNSWQTIRRENPSNAAAYDKLLLLTYDSVTERQTVMERQKERSIGYRLFDYYHWSALGMIKCSYTRVRTRSSSL